MAVTVNGVSAIDSVGVPETCPVDTLNDNPAGKLEPIENVVDPLPPAEVTGVNEVIGLPLVATVEATTNVVVSGE